MTRELVEKAEAVLGLLDPNVGSGLRVGAEIGDWLKATDELRAALRATAAAPAADAERVLEAAKAAVIAIPGFKNISARSQWVVGLVADAIRHYISPAPVADTVAVPVESLRSHLNALRDERDKKWQPAAIHLAIIWMESLIPPPPAPEPSEELVAEWEREAAEYAKATHTEGGFIRPVIHGYVAARRAEWAKKCGG